MLRLIIIILFFINTGHILLLAFFLINFFILICFFIFFPIRGILLEILNRFWKNRYDIGHQREKWQDHKVNESRLRIGNIDFIPIAEHTDRQILLFFEITLIKEFFKK